jgi:GxxExxY protein
LESAYRECLAHELLSHHLHVEREVSLPITYKDIRLEAGYRMDLIIEKSVVVELKAVDKLLPVHHAQLLTYLRFSGNRIGLLINFNVPSLRFGIKRLVL